MQILRIIGDELLILWAPIFTYRLLARLRSHGQRYVFHRWARVEVSLVVSIGLLILLEHMADQVDEDRDLLGRNAFGNTEIMSVYDPVEALERLHLGLLRNNA